MLLWNPLEIVLGPSEHAEKVGRVRVLGLGLVGPGVRA